jgi:amino acid adenylation domain-containing protein
VICGDRQLSYRELNERANQLAHYLRKLGVGREVLVGICVERSLEMVVALLATLKAGGAYVPLDPEYPKDRLAFILEDTQSKVLLTQKGLLERLPQHSARTVCLDRDWKKIAEESAENPISGAAPESLAYVIYTSGSTGKPKGVAIRQQGIVRLVVNPNYVTLSPADTIAQASNFAFDAATFEIWGALVNGARLAIIAKEWVLSPEQLAQAFVSYRVTCVFLTTAVFNRLSSEKPDAFRDLRYLLFGGETCDPDRVKAVLESGPPEHLVHVYGPTETTTFATFYEVTRVVPDLTIPIGRPITATEVILLDPRCQLVPCGVVGEICIGGPGMAAGYINSPQETKTRFVPHPFRPETGERVYRTGDLARRLPDGNVEFVGRIDDQVKIRGFRIEPAEVSTVLNSHPAVRASRVVARQQVSGEIGLTAYFVPIEGGDRPKPSELRRFLLTRLPNYMVPVSFVSLETIPLTPNGKLDYRALPAPRSQDTQEKNEYVRPRDETERVLCRLWSEVLGLERVGIDDDFFALGGHSLLAAKLFTRLDEAFGRSLPLGILFTAPTVRLLAESYRNSAASKAPSVIVPLREGGTLAPIYAVPGVFGNVVGFEDLTRELCSEHPFYGLQSVGLDGAEAPLDSIESMADIYISEIRKVQPKGPYALIGACFGATVAYEMARQLLERGEEVAFLGLLDPTRREGKNTNGNHTHVPHLIKRTMALITILRDRLQLYKEEMRGLEVKDRFKYAARKLRSFGRSLGKNYGFKGVERELHQLEVYRANILALDRYHRKPLKGRLRALEIFETARLRNSRLQEKLDWSVLWGGKPIRHAVSGKDSGDMVSRRNAHALATLLAERLREAFGDASDARREGLLDADNVAVTATR